MKYKIITLGDTRVGKTSLLRRFTQESFTLNLISTIGIDRKQKQLILDGEPICLKIWDTVGQ